LWRDETESILVYAVSGKPFYRGTHAIGPTALPIPAEPPMPDYRAAYSRLPPMPRIPPQIDLSETGPPIPGLIGEGPAMEDVYRLTRRVARSNASVLLLGETGTGKELIAKAVHRLSPRGSGPFIRVNCGALAESLLESELFGHVRGAFTGAIDNRTGRFEAAHTGTVFLDEINSTTPKLQVKLLRVLQEHEFERVGDTQTIRVDTRVIAASNRDLLEEAEAGRFREDLYYRLNVVTIYLPPLRERREDIPALVNFFLKLYNEQNFRHVPYVAATAMQALQDYSWPGNVRELQNYIERAVVLAPGDELTSDLLPETVLGGKSRRLGRMRTADVETLASEMVAQGIETAGLSAENLHSAIVNRVERELIVQVMAACDGVRIKAAERLGINRNTLHKKLQEYGLEK
jgi:DNA-binding NtrC family response regulator